jgi:hypothetical protein
MNKSSSNTNLSRLTAGSTAWASMEKVVRGWVGVARVRRALRLCRSVVCAAV